MAKVLVVEDDKHVSKLIADLLRSHRHQVETVLDGLEAFELLRSFSYDLVILDRQLPGMEGAELCSKFRNHGKKTPVLMLTVKASCADRVAGLDAGADDYLSKPFDAAELLARVRALLRRPSEFSGVRFQVGHLTLEPDTYRVIAHGKDLILHEREFSLLEFFMRNRGIAFSPEAIIERVWKSEADVSIDALRQCIRRLRKKIDLEGCPSMIHTIPGVGYRFDVTAS